MIPKRTYLNAVVSFRLSDNEKKELEDLSKKLNTNKSDLLRKQTTAFLTRN